MILANANDLAVIINYNRNHSFIVLATVIMIVNYDRKTFIVQASGLSESDDEKSFITLAPGGTKMQQLYLKVWKSFREKRVYYKIFLL